MPEQPNGNLTLKQLNGKVNEGIKLYIEGKYKEAIQTFRMILEESDIQRLGDFVIDRHKSKEVSKNAQENKQSFISVKTSALAGNPVAQNSLGRMYLNGDGVVKDIIVGMKWFHLATENGFTDAQYNLAIVYLMATGEEKRGMQATLNFIDDIKAFKNLQLAADKNHVEAQYHLGRIYEYGRGVQQDYSKACEYYQRAANQGHIEARYNFSEIHRLELKVLNDSSVVNQTLLVSSTRVC